MHVHHHFTSPLSTTLTSLSTNLLLPGPDAVWLEQHYTTQQQQQQRIMQSSSSSKFLALFVGCNKGYDALNALRMGSNNPKLDKAIWNTAMTYNNTIKLHHDVCNEVTNPQFDITPAVSSMNNEEKKNEVEEEEKMEFVQVHCIEPMPATFKELQRAALQTGYDTQGFIAFPRESKAGVENKGISNTNCKSSSSSSDDCVNVTMYSLDTYIQTYIPNINNKEEIPINYLSIDVEGWDYEVLFGGKQNVLQRVHYLEFEYNWVSYIT
jgi:FkbM family methyltransferase